MPPLSKRVLFIVSQPFFAWRGSPIRVGFDVQALAELGYTVDLLVPPFGNDFSVPGVTIHRVRAMPGVDDLPIGPSLPKLIFDVLLYFRARKMMKCNRYDALHGVEDTGAVCALLVRRRGIPFIFEKHSDPTSHKRGFVRNQILSCYAAVERWIIRRAGAVIGTGPDLAAYASQVDPHKTVRAIPDIPSSLAETTAEAAAAARGVFLQASHELLVTYVGSFAVYQGIDLLFESIPLVCRSDQRVRFVIVGGSSEEIAERKRQMSLVGVAERVTFAGKIPPDELPAVLAGSDILLSPRIAGANTPLKLLDYLKAGRPIVATENAANRQILDETTAVFSAAEPDAFAAGIQGLLNDSDLRARLGRAGKGLLAGQYNYRYFRSALGEIYERALCDVPERTPQQERKYV